MTKRMEVLKSDQWLDALRAGKTRFRVRRARRDIEDGSAPEWGADEDVTLHVHLSGPSLAKHHPVGKILTLSVDPAWAEYTEHSYEGGGLFMVEEYRLQLLAVL